MTNLYAGYSPRSWIYTFLCVSMSVGPSVTRIWKAADKVVCLFLIYRWTMIWYPKFVCNSSNLVYCTSCNLISDLSVCKSTTQIWHTCHSFLVCPKVIEFHIIYLIYYYIPVYQPVILSMIDLDMVYTSSLSHYLIVSNSIWSIIDMISQQTLFVDKLLTLYHKNSFVTCRSVRLQIN